MALPEQQETTVKGRTKHTLLKWAGKPWPDVLTSAEMKIDGLTLSHDLRTNGADEFILHEIKTRTWGNVAGLLSQGW